MAGTSGPEAPGGARRAARSRRLTRRERRALRRQQERGGKRALRSREVSAAAPAPVAAPAAAPAAAQAAAPAAAPSAAPRGGRRVLRPTERRTRGLGGTLGLTVLSAAVPGSGYLYARRRALGWIVLLGWLAVGGVALWRLGRGEQPTLVGRARAAILDLAFEPTWLRAIAIGMLVLLVVWMFVVWTSHRLVRPRERARWQTVVGNVAVVTICALVAVPVVRGAQYVEATAGFVDEVFATDNEGATTLEVEDEEDPWAEQDRVNVLLLGGDGGEGREGVRTDSVILLSIDTQTGKAVTFSLPRNMMNAQFPEHSPLHELYPYGFSGAAGDGEYMLNAVYRNVPAWHPGVLGSSANEGADAIKLAVEGSLGLPVHYYVLVNLEGFKQVVDAMGGVTVNVNEPIAIGGNTDAGVPPDDYLDPGPDQHLNGFQALWFARGRWGSDDYERMERQRCMIDAIVEAADPATLLLSYLDLLKAGEEIVYTDIPRGLGSAFVELALRVKDAKIKSVVFQTSEQFNSGDPDFDYVRATVQKAIDPPPRPPGSREPRSPAEDPEDACAYEPTGETVTASE